MKTILQFLRATLTGGILFLLPLVLLIMIINKAHLLLVVVSAPIAERLPDIIFGLDGSQLLAIILLVFVCFVAGLLFRSTWVQGLVRGLEENVISYLPGYSLMKSIAADTLGEKIKDRLVTVLVKDGDCWIIGFLVEASSEYCTVFFPDAPRYDSGDVKIVPASMVKKLNVSSSKAVKSLKNYGIGAMEWIGHPE